MYKIRIVAVGGLKEGYRREGVEEYTKRISPYARLVIEEAAESPLTDESEAGVKRVLAQESKGISARLSGYVMVTDVEGKTLTSEEFSKEIIKGCTEKGETTVVIGSSYGLDETIKKAADVRVSFGRMTMPHRLMRLVVCEQVYRALTIKAGKTYHK